MAVQAKRQLANSINLLFRTNYDDTIGFIVVQRKTVQTVRHCGLARKAMPLKTDLAWFPFPAQCPETYNYTLSACLSTGLPVMASDLGAFSERLQGRPWSWIVDWESTPTMWFEQLLQAREQLINSCPQKSMFIFQMKCHHSGTTRPVIWLL